MEEDLKFSSITKDTNIQSLGIIILELLTLTVGIGDDNWQSYLKNIPRDFSKDWNEVLKGLFETNPLKRWTLNQLLLALKDMRNSLVSPLQGDEAAIDTLVNMSRVVTAPPKKNSEITLSIQERPTKKLRVSREEEPKSSSKARRSEGKFGCDFPGCTKAYAKKYTLNRHKKTHLASSAYVCRWCSKPFVDNSSLTRHERSHSGWKPFQCPYQLTCGKRFAESNNLKQHIMRMHDGIFHTEEAQYTKRLLTEFPPDGRDQTLPK